MPEDAQLVPEGHQQLDGGSKMDLGHRATPGAASQAGLGVWGKAEPRVGNGGVGGTP